MVMKKKIVMEFIQSIRKHWEYVLLALLITIYAGVFTYYSIRRHEAFASSFDLANMDQTVWNTVNGRFFSLTTDYGSASRFSIHGDLILALISPLYLLWDNVRLYSHYNLYS